MTIPELLAPVGGTRCTLDAYVGSGRLARPVRLQVAPQAGGVLAHIGPALRS